MRVQDVMTSPAHSCTPEASLATASLVMRDYDCGALPVLDDAGRPIGVVTDRDICLAMAQRNRFSSAVLVGEVMTRNPMTCAPGTELSDVLKVMAACQIHRLPVVNGEGRLVGIVSLSDIVPAVESGSSLLQPLVATFRAVGWPRARSVGAGLREGASVPA